MIFAIPEESCKIMKKHNEIKLSEVERQAMWAQAQKLKPRDKLFFKNGLTEKDSFNYERRIEHGIAKKHGLVK